MFLHMRESPHLGSYLSPELALGVTIPDLEVLPRSPACLLTPSQMATLLWGSHAHPLVSLLRAAPSTLSLSPGAFLASLGGNCGGGLHKVIWYRPHVLRKGEKRGCKST